ncbi:MAG: thioredoxin family protein [Sphaerochaetaceae bacterium]
MKIQILGTGCAKCNKLEANVRSAINEKGIEAQIEKVTEMDKIVALGVMITPALIIDGSIISSGKVLPKEEVLKHLV